MHKQLNIPYVQCKQTVEEVEQERERTYQKAISSINEGLTSNTNKFDILFESIMNGFRPKDNPGVLLGYKPVLKSDGTINDEKLFSRSSVDYKPILSDEDKDLLADYCFELDPIDLDDPDNDIIHIKLFSVKDDMTAPPIYDLYCHDADRNRVIEIIEKERNE